MSPQYYTYGRESTGTNTLSHKTNTPVLMLPATRSSIASFLWSLATCSSLQQNTERFDLLY
jgi:hypothetical protein